MTDYFADIPSISFEGPDSDNPLAFRVYDAERQVLGKPMREQLRMAVCLWHNFAWGGHDIFGDPAFERPWLTGRWDADSNRLRLDAAFDFITRLGAPYFCFHDLDVMETPESLRDHERKLADAEAIIAGKMEDTGLGLLWGTANLFGHRRFMAGAATNPDPDIFAYAAAQVKFALETTHRLGGENYVLWGGREGYDSLLNTDMRRELDQFGRFLALVAEHKHRIGFKGLLLIEPKPQEPTKHQYDYDVSTVAGFLRRYGLEQEYAVNIEVNHATLAGHSFEHEVASAYANDVFGSIDINRGDPQNGWDTDQYPNNAADLATAMTIIMEQGGFTSGGFNFDTKLRRQSIDAEDMFHAHIGGMDTLARALLIAEKVIEDRQLAAFREQRYAGWSEDKGRAILSGDLSLADLAEEALAANHDPRPVSGRQEYLENLVNRQVG
ncbi:xylose isomerase [Parasphingopyxis algicola]|uniref:xylose isomerase n=1 Tax=Parasphingopyxis algicola TaxID=2026624 RepID=UPI0015A24C1A|nr:xylose isomerase [Parasphingopyxis algicola]QLC24743.1 xylose isomerase [Parasphingopyxis algicola]